ncbi:MFS-type transporter involved in bile tolerance (Atg22 family) [Actinoplanes lutulentus]|uniref:MFS-type transporter involved in bile tolerance (Atg22 family) n=2 Tax=Actinoplanes lutulentus TaxID=1287878 RepID=A0A327ZAT9_9ACTN|nr:MFS-type transporter involved in bile tolerance (Atg22 family) [Actinoplanes lutulentus]
MAINSNPAAPLPADPPSASSRSTQHEARALGLYLLFATLAWGIPSSSAPTLLQALLAQVDDAQKVRLAAIISTVSAILSVIAAFTVGALSDRTRSRFGARKPWILGTALFSAVSLLLVPAADSFLLILVSFVGFQVGLASMVVALSALLPDHIPADRLGRVSSLIGIGSLLGIAVGGVVASAFISVPRVGLAVVPWLMVLAAVVGWFIIPTSSTLDRRPEHASVKNLLIALRPPADRDFWLVFGGRLAFLLALVTVIGYQLFILTDHFGAADDEAGRILALAGVILAAGAGVSTVVFGVLSDRLQRRRPFIIGAAIVLAVALGLLLTSREPLAFLLFAAVASLAYGTYISVDQALMVEVLPDHDAAAKDLGFLTVANTAPGIFAPGLAAVLVAAGGYPAVFIGAIAIAMASIVFILPIKRVR